VQSLIPDTGDNIVLLIVIHCSSRGASWKYCHSQRTNFVVVVVVVVVVAEVHRGSIVIRDAPILLLLLLLLLLLFARSLLFVPSFFSYLHDTVAHTQY
jgi:hypothetical protein